MGSQGGGGKRTNWLLIKHRDEVSKDGSDDAILEENETSVASGRTLREIAIGSGKAPTPFMTRKEADGRGGLGQQEEGRRRQGGGARA